MDQQEEGKLEVGRQLDDAAVHQGAIQATLTETAMLKIECVHLKLRAQIDKETV